MCPEYFAYFTGKLFKLLWEIVKCLSPGPVATCVLFMAISLFDNIMEFFLNEENSYFIIYNRKLQLWNINILIHFIDLVIPSPYIQHQPSSNYYFLCIQFSWTFIESEHCTKYSARFWGKGRRLRVSQPASDEPFYSLFGGRKTHF